MSISNLEDLFIHELKDIYYAEKQLVKALPRMMRNATSEDLQAAFEEHATVTEGHVERLERIFEIVEKPARGKKCHGMEGLVKEGEELFEEEPSAALDAALIAAAQKVEHYEIAAYGTLATYAKLLDLTELAASINLSAETEEESGSQRSKQRA